MLEELETIARRLEQQISAYEKLHVEEFKRFQEHFEAFQRIQTDELQMLRRQLAQLTEEIAAVKAALPQSDVDATAASPAEPPVTRRELLTGKLPPFRPHHHQR